MSVILFQLDGKIPNLALMRIAAHFHGEDIQLRTAGNFQSIERTFFEEKKSSVFASAIFSRSRPLAERLKQIYPDAVVGGSGWDVPPLVISQLEKIGITTHATDYSIYPRWPHSIGFTQRGCRFTKQTCSHCSVPDREGKARAEDTIHEIWRGDPWPKNLLLLDNDTFGNPNWRNEVAAIRDGGFKVCWNQGINARMLTDEVCEAIASVHYCDDQFKTRRLYTAWDNSAHERPLFRGLASLVRHGVKPDNIMVYILIGAGESPADREIRRKKLRDFGCRPYPMPFVRTKETTGFQRWVIGAYDKPSKTWPQGVPWADWVANDYRPEGLQCRTPDSN